VLQKTRFLLRSNSLPPPGNSPFNSFPFKLFNYRQPLLNYISLWMFIMTWSKPWPAGSRWSTLFRTNGSATADILTAVTINVSLYNISLLFVNLFMDTQLIEWTTLSWPTDSLFLVIADADVMSNFFLI
jgi:hypothetical protein